VLQGGWRILLWQAAERSLALGAMLMSLPIVLIASGVIFCLSRRTPLVAHRRIGQYGRAFWMWKLRTMWGVDQPHPNGAWVDRIDNHHVPLCKGEVDPRVTSRAARFFRRYSIDELPQLLHVLSGRMALVGPRPLTAGELDVHYGPAAAEVLQLKPGITGLWQVRGRNRLTYRQRLRLDLFLARRYSPALCWMILRDTIGAVMSGHGAG